MNTPFSLKMKEKLEQKNISLRSFAEEVGISLSYLSGWLSGKLGYDPQPEKIKKMEKYFGEKEGCFLVQATSGGTAIMNDVLNSNKESKELVQEFLLKAANEKISRGDWEKILGIAKK